MPKDGNYPDGKHTRAVFLQGDVYVRRGARSTKACESDYDVLVDKLIAARSQQAASRVRPTAVMPTKEITRRGAEMSLGRYWKRLSGGKSPITAKGRTSVRRFLDMLEVDELKEAMDIAFAKGLPDHDSTFRYFCGVVYGMADKKAGEGLLQESAARIRVLCGWEVPEVCAEV